MGCDRDLRPGSSGARERRLVRARARLAPPDCGQVLRPAPEAARRCACRLGRTRARRLGWTDLRPDRLPHRGEPSSAGAGARGAEPLAAGPRRAQPRLARRVAEGGLHRRLRSEDRRSSGRGHWRRRGRRHTCRGSPPRCRQAVAEAEAGDTRLEWLPGFPAWSGPGRPAGDGARTGSPKWSAGRRRWQSGAGASFPVPGERAEVSGPFARTRRSDSGVADGGAAVRDGGWTNGPAGVGRGREAGAHRAVHSQVGNARTGTDASRRHASGGVAHAATATGPGHTLASRSGCGDSGPAGPAGGPDG